MPILKILHQIYINLFDISISFWKLTKSETSLNSTSFSFGGFFSFNYIWYLGSYDREFNILFYPNIPKSDKILNDIFF